MAWELEICANSVQSCIEAERGGATRVELCMGIPEGGTTPSAGMMRCAIQSVKIPVHVIIRPRAGDFLYSKNELKEMMYDICLAKELGAKGVVFGCLDKYGNYDAFANNTLLTVCEGMQVTFHRAFDMCCNPKKVLEDIIDAKGFTRILTSGGCATAIEGAKNIKQLVSWANGRIGIMAGCGVRVNNIKELAQITGTNMFHSSLRTSYPSEMKYKNPNVSMGGIVHIDEYSYEVTSSILIENAIKELHSIKY